MLKDIIVNRHEHKLVRAVSPRVKLLIDLRNRPDPSLQERLDYQEPDDQLVGTVHAFLKQHPGADARLLTHDTGPMATAKMVGVAVEAIPDHWLLAPESSDSEKKIGALEDEIVRLMKSEPEFRITCLDGHGNEITKLASKFVIYDTLSDEELVDLAGSIRERCPMVTDFSPRHVSARQIRIPGLSVPEMKEIFTPATEEEITNYRDKTYPQWLKKCEEILLNYHNRVQQQADQPEFRFVVNNKGTRPGKDVLITIQAKGNFEISPPPPRKRDHETNFRPRIVELPSPPKPPQGKWEPELFHGFATAGGIAASLQRSLAGLPGHDLLDSPRTDFQIPILESLNHGRDPNALYWKPSRPNRYQASFKLECEQWRHGNDSKSFSGKIRFNSDAETVSGVLECRIDAENLSDAAIKHLPVRIAIERVSVYASAQKLVDRLVSPREASGRR